MAKKKNIAKKILFVGAEAMPFAATGGLGDVLGSLPAALAKEGKEDVDVRVVIPLYSIIKPEYRAQMKEEYVGRVDLAWRDLYVGVYSLKKDGVTYYFIDNEYYFSRDTLYGCYDDGERFAYFCRAAIDMLSHIGFYPDVLHAHDWQAALSLVYLNAQYRGVAGYENIKTVFTIHNIEYQGKYDMAILGDVFGLGGGDVPLMEYGGCINLMKAAIVSANIVSTVSPRYAEEITTPEYSHGLHYILNDNAEKLCGILNGIDYDYYNPETDTDIEKNFTASDLSGKRESKHALQREIGLPERDVPMLAIISRLASHKGLDLVCDMIYNLISGNDVQLVILGKGEERFEYFFKDLEYRFGDKVKALMLYDRALSKRIYAACDIFLMPSKSEPCGLSQMIASRYGAIPVTRETGGLYDSIKGYYIDVNGEVQGNGFTFANYRAYELLDRSRAAIELWYDESARMPFVTKIMNTDFSWGVSARKYLDMYEKL